LKDHKTLIFDQQIKKKIILKDLKTCYASFLINENFGSNVSYFLGKLRYNIVNGESNECF